MKKLTLEDINSATHLGGSSTLTQRTLLEPAAGRDGLIAPAKYSKKSNAATYVVEDRFYEGRAQKAVLIDSRSSSSNRLEEFITNSMKDNRGVLGKMPRMRVTYSTDAGVRSEFDTELPHRAFDGHIRVGFKDGLEMSKNQEYIKMRNSTTDNMSPLFDISPVTVILGGWDSTRNKNQLRIASPYNGEIIGILANQDASDPSATFVRRAGARVDPIAASVKFSKEDAASIADSIKDDISDTTLKKLNSERKGSAIGLGAIPPSVEAIDGVAVSAIVRTQVISFSTLRRLRFGKGAEGDASIRSLIAAVLIDAMAGSNQELNIRANCFLRESAEPETRFDLRYGKFEEIDRIALEEADKLLDQAYEQAHEKAGITWDGRVFEVEGNPIVIASGEAETASDGD